MIKRQFKDLVASGISSDYDGYMNNLFHKVASRVSIMTGSSIAFGAALLIIITWATLGPGFNYSDTWQLIINTGTTIVTFLMVFLIQNTQNRDAKAIHLKLDELLKSVKGARNMMVNVEDLPDEDLENLKIQFKEMHERSAKALAKRQEANQIQAANQTV